MTACPRPDTAPKPPPLQIGFLCPHSPYDRRAFSGTAYHAARALEAHPDIRLTILGGHRPPRAIDRMLRRASPKLATAKLETTGLDAVIGLVASRLIDPDRMDVPYLHVTDATPGFLREVYGWDVPPETDAREARVTAHAAASVYSSHEIAARAARELNTATTAIPFGINLETLPRDCPRKSSLNRLNLLFVGTDWARKGGDIAVAALDRLRADGIEAHLTVVGRLPENYAAHPAITGAGYLNKNRRQQAAELSRLYREAHLLILPSRADCTPMVTAEAMAHGTPVLASDTGGMGTLLGQGRGGAMLPLTAPPADWAQAIRKMTRDGDLYRFLSDASFDHARTRLTWSAWAEDILTLIPGRGRVTQPRTEARATAA